MVREIIFDPLLPWPLIWALAGLAAIMVALALLRGLPGWWLRGIGAAALALGLANPSVQSEERVRLSDIVLVLIDLSASQSIADRPAQTAAALAQIERDLGRRPDTEVRVVEVRGSEGDAGTLLMAALDQAVANLPRARLAGVILLTDGQVHDMAAAPNLEVPLHALLSGKDGDWDRRLIVRNAPAFAILGEPVTLTLRVEDQGNAPAAATAQLNITVGGGAALPFEVPIGQDIELPVTLPNGGMNVLQFETPVVAGELTDRNNADVVQINGVRDRLRVLLVSGEPHAGERTWRNLLKADASVDLVHFTILRPPEKQDGVPVDELSLIAFPTRELFIEKIHEFDLIIFDRYKRRGILPGLYFDNITSYIEGGGAVLVAAGPDFAGADSLFRSGLGAALPAAPTARVFEEGFTPQVSEIGARHPVTAGLDTFAPEGGWGRWFRHVDVFPTRGQTVMTGAEDQPLLVLDRVGEGRVALLASDHAWLWDRGVEGGGPQQELLRRLAHWMMKEPELEEEALTAQADGQTLTVTRQTLAETAAQVTVTLPDGSEQALVLEESTPGRFVGTLEGPEVGLYRLSDGEIETVMALGPSAPREFEATLASSEHLMPLVEASGGGLFALSEGVPGLRDVRAGRPAAGRGWMGLLPRRAFRTEEVRVLPLLPAWLALLICACLFVAAWVREGRRA